jgi:hypothetical protein
MKKLFILILCLVMAGATFASAEDFPPPGANKGTIGNSRSGAAWEWGYFKNLKLAGVEYAFPAADGTNGQQLTTDGSGTLSWSSAGANTAWDDIGNPDADKTITFANDRVTALTFADINEDMFTIEGTGAFGDVSIMKVEQKTGNPTDGTVLEVISADANVDPFVASANGVANALVVSQDGTVDISSDLDVGGNTTLTGDLSVGGTWTVNSIAAATATQTLSLDGDTTGGVNIGVTSTGDINLGDTVVVSDGYNATIGEGSLTIDNDSTTETALTITSDAEASGGAINVTSAATTGNAITVTADGLTTGDMLLLDSTAAGLTTGNYINCYDGAATDFEVGLYGVTTIAGNASTDVLVLTAGDIQITNGDIDLDNGNFAVDTTQDLANNITRNFAGAGTSPVLTVSDDNTSSTNVALSINQDGTGASTALKIVHDGDSPMIDLDAGAARDGDAIDLAMANMLDERALNVTGAMTGASGEGVIEVHSTGNMADGAALLRLDTDTGTPAGTTAGFAINIDDDSGALADAYAVLINSANNEGLNVASGKALFAEQATFTGGVDVDGPMDIDFSENSETFNITFSSNDYPAGSGTITVYDDSTGQTNASYLLRLAREANGDAQDNFILCEDNSTGVAGNGDDMFKVDSGGAVTAAGDITANGNLVGDGATVMTGVLRGSETVAAANNDIAATESGTTYYLNAAGGFQSTLPAPAAGLNYKFVIVTAPAGGDYTVISNGTANIVYGLVTVNGAMVQAAAEDTITFSNGNAAIGDWVAVESDGTNWYVSGQGNAAGSITLTQAD